MKDKQFFSVFGGKFLGLLLILITALALSQLSSSPAQAAGIVFVQSRGTDCGSVTSCSLAFTNNNSAGNLLVLALRIGAMNRTVTVTDTRGNTYSLAVTKADTQDGHQSYIYYAPNSASGTNTLTISYSGSAAPLRFAILEYSGVSTTSPLGATASAEGSGTTISSGPINTTISGELALGFGTTANVSTGIAAGSGFTMRATTNKVVTEEQIVATPQTVTATFGLPQSDNFAGLIASFKPASGTPDTTAPIISSTTATSQNNSAIVSWTTDEPASSQVEYGVSANYGSFSAVDNTLVTSHSVTLSGLSANTTYNYRPLSKDASGNEAVGSNNTFTTTGADTNPPSVPTNLTATNLTSNSVTISWSASTDNIAVSGYKIYRDGTQVGTSTTLSYSDSGLSATTTYNYTVSAYDAAANNSAQSGPLSVTTQVRPAGVAGPLRPLATNPNYFTDGSGKAVYLTGSHTWNNLQDWGANGAVQSLDFTAYVNMMKSHGQNFTLLWQIELPKFCNMPTTASAPPSFTVNPMPWERTGPGIASDGGLKFDLTKFNPVFFDRLRTRVQQLNDAGIYTGVYFFTGEWLAQFRCATDGYPLTSGNNINSISADGGTSSINMTAPNAITEIQDALVDKMIDTLNDMPNVLWIVSEEAPASSAWWNNHLISHVHSYEATKPYQHPVGFGVQNDFIDSTLYNSDADWVAPFASVSPTTSCGSGTPTCKVNINDGDHSQYGMWNNSDQSNRSFFWSNFLRGNQSVFMDPYVLYYPRENRNLCASPVNGICSAPDPRWDNVRDQMGYTLQYANRMNLAAMTPQNNLSSTTYALANTNPSASELLVYSPFNGQFSVNLSYTTRQLAVEWFNPSTGVKTTSGNITGGSSSVTFIPPFSGDSVLYIYDASLGGTPPPPPPPAFDFSMSNGGNKSVVRGSAVTNSVSTTLISGTTQAVAYTTSGLPAGANASYSPTSCSPTCSTTLTISTTASTPLATSTITVTGTAGTLTHTTSFSLTVTNGADTQAPTVSVTAPASNATVTGTAVTVSATASDNIGVSGVQFLLDGANLSAEDVTSPYSITWNSTTTTSGAHVLSARARDASGNTALAADVNITVDNQAPTGTIVINDDASATKSRSVTLTLSASDALGSVTQMRISNTTTPGSIVAYATTKTWTLTSGSGTKTVYVQFKDASGNWSGNISDTIVLDTTAPTISAVTVSNRTNNSATITWTTNEPATSQVEYGLTTSYGNLTEIDTDLVTAHSVVVTGLASSTNYRYRVRSKDAAENERLGSNLSFTTLAGPDTTPPSVPGGLTATAVSSTQINLSWNASTDNIGVTGYDLFRDGVQIASQSTRTFNNTGLDPATDYVYTVSAHDSAGNSSAQSAPVNASTPVMIVSNVQVSNIGTNRVTVSWSTDQPSTSAIELGPTSAYGSITSEDPNLVTSHSVLVSGLTPDTLYHFRTHSADSQDRHAYSPDGTFTTLPAGTNGTFQNEILVTNLDFPDALEFLPDGSMLVSELSGKIKRVPAGATQADPTPFMQITNLGRAGGLQGLFDIELDPNFATNRYFYAFYTLGTPNVDRLSRFTADPSLTSASLSSEFVIYQDTQASGTDHHGGAIAFGNDGKIYVTIGEHFTGVSQDLTVPRGKVLRYNPDGSVPTDNPFYDGAGPNYDAVWAYGFRNPFRIFNDIPTGRIFVADVGGNNYDTAREEINLLSRGANYSWPNCEGVCGTVDPGDPIYDYGHFVPGSNTQTRDASVTGGFIYRGTQFPASYQGNYFFGDYTQNWIRRLTFDTTGNTVTGMQYFEPIDGSLDAPIGAVVCLVQGPDGSLYYCDLGWENESTLTGGKIRRIRFNSSNQAPVVESSASPLTGTAPLEVTFSSAGTNDPDGGTLTYNWDFGDGTNSTLASPQHTYTSNGQYTVRLSVSDGELMSLGDPIVIRAGNPPQPTILSPTDGITFRAGDVISFSGDATDADDGSLPLSAFTWNIDFLHEGHIHPGSTFTGTKSGSFTIDSTGHDYQGNTRYRISLTVTDSDGLETTTSVIIWPEKVNLTFDSSPSGRNFTLDGITHSTPFVYDTLVGFNHVINAPNQSDPQNNYTFSSWSDGGTQQHTIVVPATSQTYTATYNVVQNPFPSGLVAGFEFNEGSGTATTDKSGNITGTLVNGPIWTAGKNATSLLYDGVNDYVDLGNPASLQLTGSMTLSAWVFETANVGDDGQIIAKSDGQGWQFKSSPDTGVRTFAVQVTDPTTLVSSQRYSNTVRQLNTWYHVAGVYNATARTLDIYVNGVLDNGILRGQQTIPASQYNSPVNANIGRRTGGFYINGKIDDLRVYDRPLTASEIQADMNNPLP